MARARNIKPSFFQNEKLGELSAVTRLAFIGMWTIADFKGCIEWRPKRIKIQILPYDECNLDEIGIALEDSGVIRFYEVNEQKYIKIINFEKHQNPHKNEKESGSDIPDEDGTIPDNNGTTPADSLFPLTDSLLFESFWKTWPKHDRKVAKSKCEQVWRKKKLDSVTDKIIAHVKVYTNRTKTEYIKAPLVYLNGEDWDGADIPDGTSTKPAVKMCEYPGCKRESNTITSKGQRCVEHISG